MLQDVAILLGLRIEGRPIASHLMYGWQATYYELLGLIPNVSSLNNT